MHGYDLSHHDRKGIYYVVGLVAGVLGIVTTALTAALSDTVGIAVAAPSGLVIFGLTFLVFDKWIWKVQVLFRSGLIPIPNLDGTWKVLMHSTKGADPISATLVVHQTYTRLKIRLNTTASESLSHMASLTMVDPKCFRLRYEYLAEFRPQGKELVARHYGVTALTLLAEGPALKGVYRGDYYTEQGRDSNGTLTVERAGVTS